jgi:TolB-like protein/predicted Ser/Thr protein kinase
MIGQTISHYRILEKIGEGGMGVVYKAEDTTLDRVVALKFLPEHALDDEDVRSRFTGEAKAAAALDHPNICTIYATETVGERSFIAMAFVEGMTLEERIQSGPVSSMEAMDIAAQVAEGLQAAHRAGIIHRDIKSANIMIASDGRIKIMDFGLAKHAGKSLETDEYTAGTAAYMSPEQAQGKDMDQRSDLWSLGVVLYEMVTGALPFQGEYESAMVYSICNEEPQSVRKRKPDIPEALDKIIDRLLAKPVEERYGSATELIADLASAGSESAGRSAVIPGARSRRLPVRSLAAWIGGTILTIYLAFTLVGVFTGDSTDGGTRTIAVMPFENVRQDSEYEWLSEELARTLTFKLGQSGLLQVIDQLQIQKALSRLQVDRAGISLDAISQRVGEDIGTDISLVGSFAIYGDSIRILTSLVEMDTKVVTSLVEEIYAASDLLRMQSDVSSKIIARIKEYQEDSQSK